MAQVRTLCGSGGALATILPGRWWTYFVGDKGMQSGQFGAEDMTGALGAQEEEGDGGVEVTPGVP